MIQSSDLLLTLVVGPLPTRRGSMAQLLQLAVAMDLKRRAEDSGVHKKIRKIVRRVACPVEKKITKSLQPSLNLNSTTPVFHGFVNE